MKFWDKVKYVLIVLLGALGFIFYRKAEQAGADAALAETKGKDSELKKQQEEIQKQIQQVDQDIEQLKKPSGLSAEERAKKWD